MNAKRYILDKNSRCVLYGGSQIVKGLEEVSLDKSLGDNSSKIELIVNR